MHREPISRPAYFSNQSRLLITTSLLCLLLLVIGFSACTKKRVPPPSEDGMDNLATPSDALKVDLFFDATLSMKGFVSTAVASAYQQTVPLLERAVIEGWNEGQATFYKFGDDIAVLPGRDYLEASKPRFYADSKYNKKTFIERVIDRAQPDHLTVVITDLFQNNADVNQLSDKIKQKFLVNDLAVGIYAIRSDFNGTVYDVGPDNYSFIYRSGDRPDTHRPFYLLAFGSHANIAHYFDMLGRGGLSTLPDAHVLILSRHLAAHPISFSGAKLKTADKISEISPSNLLSGNYKGDRVKAFKLNRGKTAATFSIELSYDSPLPNVLVHGNELASEITAWKGEDGGAKEMALVANPEAQKALQIAARLLPDEAPFNKLELQAGLNASELPGTGIYRYRVLLRPRAYALPEWITRWNMRDDEIKAWHQHSQDFNGAKTYNLENFLSTLQGAVLSTTPPKICDIYFYINVEK